MSSQKVFGCLGQVYTDYGLGGQGLWKPIMACCHDLFNSGWILIVG